MGWAALTLQGLEGAFDRRVCIGILVEMEWAERAWGIVDRDGLAGSSSCYLWWGSEDADGCSDGGYYGRQVCG